MEGKSYTPGPHRDHGRRGRSPNPSYCYSPCYSRSPSPLSRYTRSSSHDYYSSYRSVSPEEMSYMRERSWSHSPTRECSVPHNGARGCSQTPESDHSLQHSWRCSRSPTRRACFLRSRSRSLEGWSRNHDAREYSRSPEMDEYSRD